MVYVKCNWKGEVETPPPPKSARMFQESWFGDQRDADNVAEHAT